MHKLVLTCMVLSCSEHFARNLEHLTGESADTGRIEYANNMQI